MTTASYVLRANTNIAPRTKLFNMPLQFIAGFYFSYRLGFTYLGFQSDPRMGTIASLTCSGLILVAAIFYTFGDSQFSLRFLFANRIVRWLLIYLAMVAFSLSWTAATSVTDAAGQWSGMLMEVAIVLLLVKQPDISGQVDALLKGFVVGMLFISAVAWMAPTMPDLRIGNYDFLHPNMIGLYCAVAFFMAQHLAFEDRIWRWCCLALGMTMLRSISKTSIVAFLVAESIYLLREKQIARSLKIKIGIAIAVVIAAFGMLLQSYFTEYAALGDGNTAVTLTGRTLIWSTAFFMAIEKPWIGHGFYSFRALIPSFGTFEPWHAHNELLQQFFEYGLLGVGVTLILYFALMFAAKRGGSRHSKLVSVVVLFAVVHGLTESVNFGLTIPLWLFATFAIALSRPASEATAS